MRRAVESASRSWRAETDLRALSLRDGSDRDHRARDHPAAEEQLRVFHTRRKETSRGGLAVNGPECCSSRWRNAGRPAEKKRPLDMAYGQSLSLPAIWALTNILKIE